MSQGERSQSISPPAYKNLAQYTTRFGKFPKIAVERLSNQRAAKTYKVTRLPLSATSPATYMHELNCKKLSEGGHGAVYHVKSKDSLSAIYDRLSDKIVALPPDLLSDAVVKIMPIDDEDRWLWTRPSYHRRKFLKYQKLKKLLLLQN